MSNWTQIGAVEIMALRVYPIDPLADGILRTMVSVEPGIFPIYRNADAFCWIMSGYLNERHEKIGDGLFVIGNDDSPTGLAVEFPSATYGNEQFAELLADPICQPGPAQRLRFLIPEKETEN